jgi:ABC-type dipeptide/oligopeptide/nickel transport system ATPase subunit
MDGVQVYPHRAAGAQERDSDDANATSPSSDHAHALTTDSAGIGGVPSGAPSKLSVHTSRIFSSQKRCTCRRSASRSASKDEKKKEQNNSRIFQRVQLGEEVLQHCCLERSGGESANAQFFLNKET